MAKAGKTCLKQAMDTTKSIANTPCKPPIPLTLLLHILSIKYAIYLKYRHAAYLTFIKNKFYTELVTSRPTVLASLTKSGKDVLTLLQ